MATALEIVENQVSEPAVAALMGKRVFLETIQGLYREGTVTSIRSREVKIESVAYHFPMEIFMENEETDPIPFDQIKYIVLR